MIWRNTRRTIYLLWLGLLLYGCAQAPTAATLVATVPLPATTSAVSIRLLPPTPVFGSFDPASVEDISLADLPVVPAIGANALAIYRAGLERGNKPRVFSKLGDCMTENPYFLVTFSDGDYNLGAYTNLQPTLDQFAGVPARGGDWKLDSFATIGLAAASGFNIAGPLDATWANPEWCRGGESPAACEYRVAQPSIAVIMFGTNDVAYTDPASYDYFLRALVAQTIERDILPLLNTFPTRPENPEKSQLLNRIVARVARDYDVPLINLNRAVEPLPFNGVDPNDTIHLSIPADKKVDYFTPENLQAGFTVRNLVTLQALQAVLDAAAN